MRIGIISINAHTKTLNYACPLHTYAFQQFLLKNGIESTVIDYTPVYYEQDYDPVHPINFYLKRGYLKYFDMEQPEDMTDPEEIKAWEKDCTLKRLRLKKFSDLYDIWPIRYEKFQKFFDKYYIMTEKTYSTKSLEKENPDFDCYICVTDVIWKVNGSLGFDKGFFLASTTMNGKAKIGYSVSRGVYHGWTEQQKETFLKYIEPFEYISAREPSFAEHIHELTGRDVPVVLDPVFLMDREFWHNLAIPPQETELYVLLYAVMEAAADSVRKALAFAKRKGLKLVILSEYESNRTIPENAECEIRHDLGCEEWLGYIEHAEYIITNSFHSSAFSIIFEKEFYVGSRHGDKVDTILNTFGLEKRRFTKKYDSTLSDDKIDYDSVRELLKEKRKESGDYIINCIKQVEGKYKPQIEKRMNRPYKLRYISAPLHGFVKLNIPPVNFQRTGPNDKFFGYISKKELNGSDIVTVLPSKFECREHKLVGWYGRSTFHKVDKWYCTDGKFHTDKEIKNHPEYTLYQFREGEVTDAYAKNRAELGDVFNLCAIWKDKKTGTIITSRKDY